jgi:FkbM family methyltransferase
MIYDTADGCQVENLSQILMDYFGYKTDGVFVDVGAYDGNIYSNTWGLARAGWKGLYIEPITEYYKLCVENHKNNPNVEVLQLAIGNHMGEVDFHVCGPLSTYSDFYLNSKTWGSFYDPNNIQRVYIDTLDRVLLLKGFEPGNIDVISIDTEGSEPQVFEGFTVEHWLPKMLIIEQHELNENKDELARNVPIIESYLSQYKKIYKGWVNSIYVL